METWKFEEGYENKKIVDSTSVNLAELKTDRDVITAYAELSKASYHRDSMIHSHGEIANEKARQIVDDVRARLEKAGWHVHIFANGSIHDHCDVEEYLHAFAGLPELSNVVFSSERNIELTPKELFNDDGTLRTMQETLDLLRERIGEDNLQIDKMAENGEIEQETADIVKAIMKEQNLEEIQEIDEDNRTLKAGESEWTWRKNDNEAEEEVRENLEDDDYSWKEAVANDNTTLGFDEWIDEVINVDGWQNSLCTYDGQSYELPSGVVYWRSN